MKEILSKEIILNKIRIAMTNFLSKQALEDLDLDIIEDIMHDNVVQTFKTWVFGETVEQREKEVEFTYPKDWWNMFKYQHFPTWLTKKFPIRWEETSKIVKFKKTACYPQLPLHFPNVGHIKFITDLFEKGKLDFENEEMI